VRASILAAITSRRGPVNIVVDFDKCDSNALCVAAAPVLFEVRDDNFLYILNETPGEDQRAQLEEAVRNCPTGAISIKED
jgi:ferredoxin